MTPHPLTPQQKRSLYETLLSQVAAVVDPEADTVANMANVAALINETFHFWWTGFYRVLPNADTTVRQLVLGPYQGPVACTRIAFGRGVCGTAWKECRTIVVPDVEAFPGHIACSSLSRSEIVVPLFDAAGQVTAVLDIDSQHLATFDDVDSHYLELMLRHTAL